MEPTSSDSPARDQARRRRTQQVQRRRLVLAVCVLGLIILIVALAVALSGGSNTAGSTTSTTSTPTSLIAATYTAYLTGDESVPKVTTEATAAFSLTYDPDADTLTFVLEIDGLTNPSVANIYEGDAGENGVVVLSLFSGPTEEGRYSGKIAEGPVEDADLTGPLAGKTAADLIALIKEGRAYVSVGNTSHPVDAIRGQIR